MSVTVAAVMRRVRNYFEQGYRTGSFTVSGGRLSPAPSAGWVAIEGSRYYSGVHQMLGDHLAGTTASMPEETFEGTVWMLAPPEDFLALCQRIRQYEESKPDDALRSERFGDYSYTRAAPKDWPEAFARELRPFRKMMTEVQV